MESPRGLGIDVACLETIDLPKDIASLLELRVLPLLALDSRPPLAVEIAKHDLLKVLWLPQAQRHVRRLIDLEVVGVITEALATLVHMRSRRELRDHGPHFLQGFGVA